MGFQTFITHYREDPDQQNLIDWIQESWVSHVSLLLLIADSKKDNRKPQVKGVAVNMH